MQANSLLFFGTKIWPVQAGKWNLHVGKSFGTLLDVSLLKVMPPFSNLQQNRMTCARDQSCLVTSAFLIATWIVLSAVRLISWDILWIAVTSSITLWGLFCWTPGYLSIIFILGLEHLIFGIYPCVFLLKGHPTISTRPKVTNIAPAMRPGPKRRLIWTHPSVSGSNC